MFTEALYVGRRRPTMIHHALSYAFIIALQVLKSDGDLELNLYNSAASSQPSSTPPKSRRAKQSAL